MLPDSSNYMEDAQQTQQPNIFLLIFLLFVAIGISGVLYVFVLSMTKSQNKELATRPTVPQEQVAPQTTTVTPTPYENPFASSSAYTNPFAESTFATEEAKPYENPFDKLR